MSEYSDVLSHHSMLFDRVRNQAYERAIHELITPDSVVMDLGSGLGIHGLMAARAGARKVYLIDPSPAVLTAAEVARANGFEQVECIQSTVEQAQLNERVDLIISVFTGNFLLTEDLLPSLIFARDRFLAPDGKLLPDRAKMIVVPVSLPEVYEPQVDGWSDRESESSLSRQFNIDYSSVRKMAVNQLYYDHFNESQTGYLGEPAVVNELNFHSATKAQCLNEVEVKILQTGVCHGWMGWFEMQLGDHWLSTSPLEPKMHWSQVFLPLPEPVSVRQGDFLALNLKRPQFGDWSWETSIRNKGASAGGRLLGKQSTFLSRPINAALIQKQTPGFIPRLNTQARLLKFTLDLFSGARPVESMIEPLLQAFPEQFGDRQAALNYLKLQVEKLSE